MQFLSDEYDDLAACRKKIWNQIKRLSSKLDTICTQVDRISQAVDSFEMYSYQYNIKIVGIPQVAETESPEDKTSICLKLLPCIGADITLQSIDSHTGFRQQCGRCRPRLDTRFDPPLWHLRPSYSTGARFALRSQTL